MDYRKNTFRIKFENAAKYLQSEPKEVVSIKLRDNVGSYHEYDRLLDILEREVNLKTSPVKDGLQGDGYLVQHRNNRIIIVKHETGLEILYIAGSIASLIGLIPLVLKCWNHLRGSVGRHNNLHDIELRRFDEKGRLIEQHSHELCDDYVSPFNLTNGLLNDSIESIEGKVRQLKSDVRVLTERIDKIEKSKNSKSCKKEHNAKKMKNS